MPTITKTRSHTHVARLSNITEASFDTSISEFSQPLVITLPAKAQVTGVTVHSTGTSSAAGMTSLDLVIGLSEDGNEFFTSTDIISAGTWQQQNTSRAYNTSVEQVWCTFSLGGTASFAQSDLDIQPVNITVVYYHPEGEIIP